MEDRPRSHRPDSACDAERVQSQPTKDSRQSCEKIAYKTCLYVARVHNILTEKLEECSQCSTSSY